MATVQKINLSPYPFDWSGLEDFSYPKDKNGLPLVDFGDEYGLRHNPITIAQYGLFSLQNFSKTESQKALKAAEQCVVWLFENFKDWKNGIGAWVHQVDLNFYGPKAPWISGMAQGQGISLLLRFYQFSPKEAILEIATSAMRAFSCKVTEGGVVANFPDGSVIFEEFTTTPASRVLNGHMFALLGIFDYATFFQNDEAERLFRETCEALAQNLKLYDTGFWNLYDLHASKRLASPMYMIVHERLLRIFFELTGNSLFEEFAQKWRGYRTSPVCKVRWLFSKTYEKIRLRNSSFIK